MSRLTSAILGITCGGDIVACAVYASHPVAVWLGTAAVLAGLALACEGIRS